MRRGACGRPWSCPSPAADCLRCSTVRLLRHSCPISRHTVGDNGMAVRVYRITRPGSTVRFQCTDAFRAHLARMPEHRFAMAISKHSLGLARIPDSESSFRLLQLHLHRLRLTQVGGYSLSFAPSPLLSADRGEAEARLGHCAAPHKRRLEWVRCAQRRAAFPRPCRARLHRSTNGLVLMLTWRALPLDVTDLGVRRRHYETLSPEELRISRLHQPKLAHVRLHEVLPGLRTITRAKEVADLRETPRSRA